MWTAKQLNNKTDARGLEHTGGLAALWSGIGGNPAKGSNNTRSQYSCVSVGSRRASRAKPQFYQMGESTAGADRA